MSDDRAGDSSGDNREKDRVRPLVLGVDAGGTMTDTFIVDEHGNFAVGKAATTPGREIVGLLESAEDAIGPWDISPNELFSELQVALYSGTTMLNALLSHTGVKVGVITTKGMEDTLRMGRGIQSWSEYSYQDRMHAVTHQHPGQLVPRRLIHGATERVDRNGRVVIPLYEDEVRAAAERLTKAKVDAIVVSFLFSFLNTEHEETAGEIARGIAGEIPVYLSSDIRPTLGEQSRINSTVAEAYAAGPVRAQLEGVETGIQDLGYRNPLQTVLAYGGLANVKHRRLHETLISGPMGGIAGAKLVAELRGFENVLATDMGGTSFDIGTIVQRHAPVVTESMLARYLLSVPTIAMETISAGAGMYIQVDPHSGKIELGPESAGADPGPVCFGRGTTQPTICDCDLILGYLNPDNFLGGTIKLDTAAALAAIEEHVSGPLGTDPYDAAEGIVKMLELDARDALVTLMSARGVDVSQFYMMAYGGSGPLHMAGYSDGLPFKGMITFPFAAAFSAFGCSALDYTHRYEKSLLLAIGDLDDLGEVEGSDSALVAATVDGVWDEFEKEALGEFEVEGMDVESAVTVPFARMRYGGQLFDVEVPFPDGKLSGGRGLRGLIQQFEEVYDAVNSKVARHREAGVEIHGLGVLATIPTVKPQIPKRELEGTEPPASARNEDRQVYRHGAWRPATNWQMEELRPGNIVSGLAVVEHPATTLVVPEDMEIEVDEYLMIWLRKRDERQGTQK